jgi:hypothetical protein
MLAEVTILKFSRGCRLMSFNEQTSGRGLYTLLPLAVRTLAKIEAIIDQEFVSTNILRTHSHVS